MKRVREFYKIHGCGNDFIVIDIRPFSFSVDELSVYAQELCRLHFSVGADGVVFIDRSDTVEAVYRWHFYNSDGSRAGMCGNASRCVAYIACLLGITPQEHCFQTDVGKIHVKVDLVNSTVKTQLTPYHSLAIEQKISYEGNEYTYHFIDTGVPHVVCFVDDVVSVPVQEMGAYIRYHQLFFPHGANVNFAQIVDSETMHIRTYERGVEDETYACGTGAVASTVIAYHLNKVGRKVSVYTASGEFLEVSLQDDAVFLQAPVSYVFKGTFS